MINFSLVSAGPKKESKNSDNKPLTDAEVYGRLSRRKLQKEWIDHNYYEIHAIFEDMAEEAKEQFKLHGFEVEEPKKLSRSGISEIMAYFNG